MDAPLVNVGIMTGKALSFVFNGEYIHTESSSFLTGEQRALFVNGNIVYNGKLYKELFFEPGFAPIIVRPESCDNRSGLPLATPGRPTLQRSTEPGGNE